MQIYQIETSFNIKFYMFCHRTLVEVVMEVDVEFFLKEGLSKERNSSTHKMKDDNFLGHFCAIS